MTNSDSNSSTGAIVLNLSANTPEKAEAERRAKAAVADFMEDKPAGPTKNTYWMGEGFIEVSVFNRRVHLSAVFVLPDSRKAGLGTQYLRALLEAADRHGSAVQCSVVAFGDDTDRSRMTNRQLTAWYKRHGFVPVPDRKDFMVRPAAALEA